MLVEWNVTKVTVNGETRFKLVQYELKPMVNLPTLGGMSYVQTPMAWLQGQDGEHKTYRTRKEAQCAADKLTQHHASPLGCYPRPLRFRRE